MQGSNYQVDKEPLLSIPLPNPENILEAQQQKIINPRNQKVRLISRHHCVGIEN